jgi:PAS domain S-box-containing protein
MSSHVTMIPFARHPSDEVAGVRERICWRESPSLGLIFPKGDNPGRRRVDWAGVRHMVKQAVKRVAGKDTSPETRLGMMTAGLDLLDQGVGLFDRDFRLVICNAQFRALMKYPKKICRPGTPVEAIVRFNVERGLFGEGDIETLTKKRVAEICALETYAFERALSDGTVIGVTCQPIPGGGLQITYADMTENRRAERALRESTDRCALAMDATNEAVFDWNIDTGQIYYSPQVEAIFGLTPRDLETVDDWVQRIHPEDRPAYKAAVIALLKGETEHLEIEYRYRAKDGGWRWVRHHAKAQRDETGRAYRMTGSGGDITEQKQLAQRLESLQGQLTTALENVSDGFSLFDAEDRLVVCNDTYRNFVFPGLDDILVPGVNFETILRTATERGHIKTVATPDNTNWIDERLARHLQPKGPFIEQWTDGRWIQVSERRTKDGGTVAVYTEVTELKHRQTQLAEANAEKDNVLRELGAVLDAIQYGVLFMDKDLRIRMNNQAYRDMWQMPEAFFANNPTIRETMEYGRKTGLYGVSEEDWEAYLEARLGPIEQGETATQELQLSNGKLLQYQCVVLPDGGRMLTYFDITELKRREQDLAENSAILGATLESMDQGVSMLDSDLRMIAFNRRFLEILGLPAGRFEPGDNFEDLLRYNAERGEYGKGDTEEQVRARLSLIRSHAPHSLERTRPDGTVVEIRGKPVAGWGLLTTYTDVTEERRSEQILRQKEEQFRGIFEHGLDDRRQVHPGEPGPGAHARLRLAHGHDRDHHGHRNPVLRRPADARAAPTQMAGARRCRRDGIGDLSQGRQQDLDHGELPDRLRRERPVGLPRGLRQGYYRTPARGAGLAQERRALCPGHEGEQRGSLGLGPGERQSAHFAPLRGDRRPGTGRSDDLAQGLHRTPASGRPGALSPGPAGAPARRIRVLQQRGESVRDQRRRSLDPRQRPCPARRDRPGLSHDRLNG